MSPAHPMNEGDERPPGCAGHLLTATVRGIAAGKHRAKPVVADHLAQPFAQRAFGMSGALLSVGHRSAPLHAPAGESAAQSASGSGCGWTMSEEGDLEALEACWLAMASLAWSSAPLGAEQPAFRAQPLAAQAGNSGDNRRVMLVLPWRQQADPTRRKPQDQIGARKPLQFTGRPCYDLFSLAHSTSSAP